MQEALISVIVPVFNTEGYLAACLDSILSQSHRQLEVIVIDDGSTDFSLDIAEKYAEADDRIKVYSYENAGLSEARNRGLEVSTGDYITFVDSDDMLFPNALEILLSILRSNDADIVEGVSVSAKVFQEILPPKHLHTKVFSPSEAIADVLYQNFLKPSAWGKIFNKDLFIDIRFRKGVLYEDLDIFYRIFEASSKIVWIDYPVYFYRETEGSILHTWRPQRLDVLDVTENLENYISERYPDILPAAKDRRLSANFNMFALCSLHGDHENASQCWQLIKRHRRDSLFNPKVRMKNKSGILLSYLGRRIFKTFSGFLYK